jgi:hypothetical protein
VNVCHPGRLDVIAPRFSFAEPLNERAPELPRLALNASRPLTLLFTDRPNPLDTVFVRPAALKKCCEPEGALRNDAGSAARPDGLKLARDGEIGILPLTMLA